MPETQINGEELALGKLLMAEIDRINQSSRLETTQGLLPDEHEHRDLAEFFHVDEQLSEDHAMHNGQGLDVFLDPAFQVDQPLTPPQQPDRLNDEEIAKLFRDEAERITQTWEYFQFETTPEVLLSGYEPQANQYLTDSYLGQQQQQQHMPTSAPWDDFSGQISYPSSGYPSSGYPPGPSGQSRETESFRNCRTPADLANYWSSRHTDPNTARPKPVKYKSPEQRAAARLEKKASDDLRKVKKAAAREKQMQRDAGRE